MKRYLLGLLFVGFLFQGCVYDQPSLDYAKKHKLDENLYSQSKIICVSNNIDTETFYKTLKKNIHSYFNYAIKNICYTNYAKIKLYHLRHSRNYIQNCMRKSKLFNSLLVKKVKNAPYSIIQIRSTSAMPAYNTLTKEIYINNNIISEKDFSDPMSLKRYINQAIQKTFNENDISCKRIK